MTLLQHIKASLEALDIPSPEHSSAPLAVALSGGADSVCLLLALRELGYKVHALHCNFELRGAESDADEAFCRRLCRQNAIPLSVTHFRTTAYAKRHGLSIEMAARQLRYEWFATQMKASGAIALCVAHHRDDNVETVLLNLVRGTGIRGLCGMQTRNDKGIVRPMLDVTRNDIEAWLTERGQTWRTDSTNLQAEAAQRNTIRLEVLPALLRLNPAASANIAQTASYMQEAMSLYNYAVESLKAQVEHDDSIDIKALRQSIAPRTLLYEILRERGFNAEQTNDIFQHLDGEAGHEWQSHNWRLLRDRGRLLLQQKAASTTNSIISEKSDKQPPALAHESCYMPLEGLFETSTGLRLLIRRQAITPQTFDIPRNRNTVCFDLEKLSLPLTIRPTKEGDRLQPFGMTGTRLVSDLLTDNKLSLFERERQLVVCSADTIAWVVGLRAAAGFEVDEHTRHVMMLTIL